MIKNIGDLRDDLLKMYEALKKDEVSTQKASEINNTAGKVMNTAKLELQYAALRKEQPNIPFLETLNGEET